MVEVTDAAVEVVCARVEVDDGRVDVVDWELWPDGVIKIACGSWLRPPKTPKFMTEATTAPPTIAGATKEMTLSAFGEENLRALIELTSALKSSLIFLNHP